MTNFNKTCRLCLRKHSHLTDMYTQDVEHIDIYSKLIYIVPELDLQFIDIHNLICDKCCLSIQNAFEFKNLLLEIAEILRTCVNYSKLDEKSEKIFDFIENHQDIDVSLIDFLKSKVCEIEERDTEIINNIDSFSEAFSKDGNFCHRFADFNAEFNLKQEPDCGSEGDIQEGVNECSLCECNDTNNRNCQNCIVHVEKSSTLNKFQNNQDGKKNKIIVTILNKCPTYFECKHCKKLLSSENELTNHEKQHVDSKSFNKTKSKKSITRICTLCEKTFKFRSQYILHMRQHTGEKPYKCTECKKGFSLSFNLTRHMRIHSAEGKPLKCTECDKSFSHNNNLIRHMRIHNGEKPYICKYCEKSFSEQNNLTRHMRTHTGEKPYECIQCEMCFTYRDSLSCHMKTHTSEIPYKCTECEKGFFKCFNLTKHMRIHSGEKPFTCKYCEKRFREKNHLTRHLRIHTGEKLYRCTHCNKSFTNSSNLHSHIKLH